MVYYGSLCLFLILNSVVKDDDDDDDEDDDLMLCGNGADDVARSLGLGSSLFNRFFALPTMRHKPTRLRY